jgi:hypothetical protein
VALFHAAADCLIIFGAFVAPYLPEGMIDQILESPTGIFEAVSGLVFLVGEILFGISVIRAGVFSKIASALFMVGMFLVPLGEVFPESAVVIGSIIAGVGLIWWGIELFQQTGAGTSLMKEDVAP